MRQTILASTIATLVAINVCAAEVTDQDLEKIETPRMVLREGAALAFLGIAIGLAAAFAFTRLILALLYDVSPRDPATFASVPVLLAAVALVASWLPAQRAAAVEPLEAIRYE